MTGGHTQVQPETGPLHAGGHPQPHPETAPFHGGGHPRFHPETAALHGGGHPQAGHASGAAFPYPGAVPGPGAFPAAGIRRGGRAAPTEADGTAVLPRADDHAAPDLRRAAEPGGTRSHDSEQTTVLRRVRVADLAGPGTAEPRHTPWEEPLPGIPAQPTAADPTHDPHEVTVQMDAVQLGDVRLNPAPGAARGAGRESADGPVFVDESGRRSRTFRRLGMLVGLACAVYAVIIVATLFSGSSDAPWVPVPGQDENAPASQVDTPPLPSASTDPTPGSSAPAGSAGSPAAPAGAVPGTAGSTPGSGAGTSAGEEPAAGTSAGPGTGQPSTSPVSPAGPTPAPSTPGTGASPGPSHSTGGGKGRQAHHPVFPTTLRPHL
ncbi:hypothetical protein ACWER6_20155 [Streptomyces sp. NPDC004009]